MLFYTDAMIIYQFTRCENNLYWRLAQILRRRKFIGSFVYHIWFQCLVKIDICFWNYFVWMTARRCLPKIGCSRGKKVVPVANILAAFLDPIFCSRSNLVFALLSKQHEGWLALASFTGNLHHHHRTFKSVQPTNMYSHRENINKTKDLKTLGEKNLEKTF